MIIEISVAIIALAFVALVIYLIALLKALKTTLTQMNPLILDVRKELDDMGSEAKKIIEHANQLSEDLKYKMESLDSLFKTVSNIGDVLEQKTAAFKSRSTKSSVRHEAHVAPHSYEDWDRISSDSSSKIGEQGNLADVLELAGLGVRLWRKLKKRR